MIVQMKSYRTINDNLRTNGACSLELGILQPFFEMLIALLADDDLVFVIRVCE